MELENNLQLRSGISGLQKVGVEQSPRPRDQVFGGCLENVGAPLQEGEGIGIHDDYVLTAWDRRSWAIIR